MSKKLIGANMTKLEQKDGLPSEQDKSLKHFVSFVRKLFGENCVERRACGQKEFASAFEYFKAYPVWLEAQYSNSNKKDI